MQMELKQLKNIPVETKNGLYLGKVINLQINTEGFIINKLFVVKKRLFSKSQRLLIHPNQIISISEQKILVQDNVEAAQIKQSLKDATQIKQTTTNITDETASTLIDQFTSSMPELIHLTITKLFS